MDSVDFDGFEWDLGKSDLSYVKHGIDFEAAIRIFDDVYVHTFSGKAKSTRASRGISRSV